MTLHEVIEQLINLGDTDPQSVASRIRSKYDDKWLARELLGIADDILPDIARAVVGRRRRSALSLSKLGSLEKKDIMLQAAWLPGLGWVEFGLFTIDHWHALADRYRKGAAALSRYAEWCEANEALMREQQIAEFRQVKGTLPQLPAAEEAA